MQSLSLPEQTGSATLTPGIEYARTMSEDERLTAIAAELVEDWHNERAPTLRVVHDDAAAITCGLHFAMDQLTDARAQYADENGQKIACDQGCTHCCESLVMVLRGESIAIAEWMLDPSNKDTREWFLTESYQRWRDAIGDAPSRAQAALRGDDTEAYVKVSLEVWQKRVMCAFNRDGLCAIYNVRPNTCRNSHALDSDEHCLATSTEAPETIPFEDIQSFRFGTRPLTHSLHRALGGETGITSSVCHEVHELLTDPDQLSKAGRGSDDSSTTSRNRAKRRRKRKKRTST